MRKHSLMQSASSIAIILGLSLCFGAATQAAEEAPAAGTDSGWHFDMKSWIWLMGMKGTIAIGPVKADADASFGDVLKASDSLLAFSGRIEAGKGPFTGYIDGMWAKIGVDNRSGPLGIGDIDVNQEMGIVDFGLMYRIYDGPLLGERQPANHDSSVDVYVGGRYMTLSLELSPAVVAARTLDKDWVDPIIGIKLVQPLTDKLHFEIWGDVGGFGVSSDITWSATAVLGYDTKIFDLDMTLYGGYRAIGWDFTDGGFKWDVILHGPTLGATIWF
ncbi:MAG: hypothetical protein GC162_20290 [Planctomycetes bacterium]|nr:hypothetical protein [Planctomycetota bacterium]